jgi:hypothetical protein
MDFFVKLSERALDPDKSTAMEPYHTHSNPEPIDPGRIYRFDIRPMAHRFKKGKKPRSKAARRKASRAGSQPSDHRHRWLLCACGERPRDRRAAEQRDELSSFQPIEMHPGS